MTDLENFRGDSRKSVLKFEGKRRWRVLSNVVRIRQDQETLQTIDLSFLKEWLMRQQLYFGVLNEAYALENYEKTDADIRGIRFATEHIVRSCIRERKDFVISLCAEAHRLISGEQPDSVEAWYRYLVSLDPAHTVIICPSIIPGYATPMIIGRFR